MLWVNTNGKYSEWTVNSQGEYVSSVPVPDVIDVESFYGYDIDGSGTVGYAQPKQLKSTAPEVAAQDVLPDQFEFNAPDHDHAETDAYEDLGQLAEQLDDASGHFYAAVQDALDEIQDDDGQEHDRLDIASYLEDDVFSH